MKILVLTTTFPKDQNDYGTPRFVYNLAYNFSLNNINTLVLTPDRPDSIHKIEEITDNFSIYRFKYFFKKNQKLTSGEGIIPSIKKAKIRALLIPFLISRQFFKAIRITKKYNIDIINSHWMVPSGLIGAFIQKFYKKKNFVTVHAAALYLLERIPFGRLLARYIFRNSTRIFVVSNYGKDRLFSLLSKSKKEDFDKKVKVIPMGTYLEDFKQINREKILDEEKFNLLFLGRLVEKKGLKYAIDSMKELNDDKFLLHICGDGPLKSELEIFVKKIDMEKKILFYGRISEKEKINFFTSADVLLVPSIETDEGDKEGLPVVILEALAAGLPIIATDVGGIKDAVINNFTGKLIEQKNSESIIDAINELSNNKKLYNDIRKNCKKYSKKFDWGKIADEYLLEIMSSYNE